MNVLSVGLLAAAAIIGAKPDDPAAKELKLHLELITGEEVRFGKSAGPGERAYVFEPSCLDGNPEACAWEWTATNVVFRGKTYFAVIDFLENGLGVRWPGGSDISYVPMNPIVPRTTRGEWTPALRIRGMRRGRAVTPEEKEENEIFARRMRHGRHDVPFYRHAFPTWWKKYGKEHKEYFAMRKDGRRGPINAKPAELDGDIAVYAANTGTSLGMCVTSTGLVAQVIANWKDEGAPKFVNICENDVPGTGACHCPACVALDVVPDAFDPRYEYYHADRYVWFGNRVLEAARKVRPDAQVCYYAYNASRDAPKRERPLPGSFIGLVPTDFREGAVARYVAEWKAMGLGEFFFRPNRHWYYLAEFIPLGAEEQFFDEFRAVAQAGGVGFDYDAASVQPGGFGWLERYVLYHGMQDPSKSFAHWEDHFCSAYGAAAEAVKAYYRYWRRTKWNGTLRAHYEEILTRGKFNNFGRGLAWDIGRYYSEADFAASERFVSAAESTALPPPQAALVRKFRLAHEHAKLYFRAVAERTEENARTLLAFRRANGYVERPWYEKYYGDLTGIGALLDGKKIRGSAADDVLKIKRGSPFLPVFSAGMGQDGGTCKFPELAVFRDGIPSFPVNSAMKPNPRPFSKSREYPKKYVRRIEGKERRTTPYRFEEMFANPAATIDSAYARSGKPFFVYERMSRPPYFLPTDGCPLAIRESYEAWKKAHPGFIAFNSLWELDSDSNYFENFYDRMGDESIAAELHAAFGPPDAKGRAHRVRWAEKIFRIGADFHFGETTVYPLCSGNPGYEHIFGAMGAKGLWYEATTQSMGPWNTAAAFVRGAARQRGLDYGWYMAHYMTGWTRDGKLVKGHNQRAYGYEGLLKEPHPDRGESRSLFRRKALFGWMIGAKYLMCEAWSHLFIDRVDGRDVPSDSARDFNEIYELSETTDRGEPFTPLAVLTPLAEPCNVNYQHDRLLDPKTQTDIFNTLVPFLGADGKPSVSRKAGDQGCLFNSEFANAFDVLCPDSGQDSAAFAKALSRYRHVLIAGEAFDKAKFDTAALAAFEKAGGKIHRYPSPECDTPEKLRALLLSIQDETLPVKVEGDVQWGVNFVEGKREEGRGKRGRYLVYLINNKGVIKYCDEPETFDVTKVAHVTVTVKATGETFVRDVKPGDFCLLSLEGK